MKKITAYLYFWVLIAILCGGFTGLLFPVLGVQLGILGEGFMALVKMMIAPIIFCTVVLGIARSGNMKKVGRVGGKAIVYFELVSTLALVTGLCVVHWLQPGQGFNIDPASLQQDAVAHYTQASAQQSVAGFIVHSIPTTFVDAFTGAGNLLQVLMLAILFGYSLIKLELVGQPVHLFIENASQIFYAMMASVMRLAPLGAGGAMAFTFGKYGIDALKPLLQVMGCFYLTCALFILVILGGIAAWSGFNILRFLLYLREELLTVLGTSSSESALVPLMAKLETMGCSKSVVGLVVPAGYSFNLDGTNIYLTIAVVFIAQALNIELTDLQLITLLGVAMLTSKGAAGVAGSGFITLAATLAVLPTIPVEGMVLLIGIDRFMSEARSLTNFIGNGVATLVISRWENELDLKALKHCLHAKG